MTLQIPVSYPVNVKNLRGTLILHEHNDVKRIRMTKRWSILTKNTGLANGL